MTMPTGAPTRITLYNFQSNRERNTYHHVIVVYKDDGERQVELNQIVGFVRRQEGASCNEAAVSSSMG